MSWVAELFRDYAAKREQLRRPAGTIKDALVSVSGFSAAMNIMYCLVIVNCVCVCVHCIVTIAGFCKCFTESYICRICEVKCHVHSFAFVMREI